MSTSDSGPPFLTIKYEGDNQSLIWKHPQEDFNVGAQLIVPEWHEAIFICEGQALDSFGAGTHTLETQSLPLLNHLHNASFSPSSIFSAQVYFVNLSTQTGLKWGTPDPRPKFIDPATGIPFAIGAGGVYNLRVTHARKLLMKLMGDFSEEAFEPHGGYFHSLIVSRVKMCLTQEIKAASINLFELDAHLEALSETIRSRLNPFFNEYGLTLPEFIIDRFVTPDDDPNFVRLREQHASVFLNVRDEHIRKQTAEAQQARRVVEAETAAKEKVIGAQSDAESYRLQAEAEAIEMRMKGYTYQQESQRQIGLEAMKNGIVGSGGSGGGGGGHGLVSDTIGLGVMLGAAGPLMNMTREMVTPLTASASEIGKEVGGMTAPSVPAVDGWTCSGCGAQSNVGKFCATCGKAKPMTPTPWDCPGCGAKGNPSKFCTECGKTKPAEPAFWICAKCETKNNVGKFCSECGASHEPSINIQ